MATANSVGAGNCSENSNSSEPVLDVIRRKLGKVQANLESNYESVIQRILPGKRKGGSSSRPSSLYDSEAVLQPFSEQIEMASLKQRGTGRGHQFLACHLSNPTWCDKCGDFIWGLYKQCQRCNNPPEGKPTRNGGRRVSFREIPETFTLNDEGSLPREAFATKRESDSSWGTSTAQNNSTVTKESVNLGEDTCAITSACAITNSNSSREEPKSVTDSSALSNEESSSRTFSNRQRLSRDSERKFQQRSQPVEIPIKLVNVPVSRQHSDLDTSALNSPSLDRFIENRIGVSDLPTLGSEHVGTKKTTNVLPPKVPVNIPIRVEKSKPTVDTSVPERSPFLNTHKNYGDNQSKRESDDSSRERFQDDRTREIASEHGRSQVAGESEHRRSRTYNPKRSSLLENLKRLSSQGGRPWSGRGIEPFMEFFSGDEHFQEFERVFETINNHRLSRDLDMRRPGSWWREDRSSKDPIEDDEDLGVLHIDETFLDFFDHDEDFMEFERELEKIKSNRRSRLLENLGRRSSCDIFSDVKAYCDRSLRGSRTPSSSPKVERRLSAATSADADLWNSAEEWEVVMNKLKRNSRLFSDQARSGSSSSLDDDVRPKSRSASSQSLDRLTAGHSDQCPCLRDCQYTCHLHCVPSVTLDCTTVSPGSGEGPVATPTDLPSPSASAETSLTERRTIVTHRSPQKQQQQPQQQPPTSSAYSELSSQASQQGRHLASPGGAVRSSSPSQNVLSSSSASNGDPLSGACVPQTTTLLSSSALSSTSSSPATVCVDRDQNQNAKSIDSDLLVVESRAGEETCDSTNEKDETDSGYRSGTIPDEKLPKAPSQATLNRKELRRKIQTFNHFVPKAKMEEVDGGESFQGFLRVTLNLIRPITMELGARPPSIYELLTREHIVEQSTQHIAFYMPRDTVKSIHITSKTTTKEVVTGLLKKFHILDHPRKFALYEQEFSDKNKLVRLRRLTDKDFPLVAMLSWDPERVKHYRLVLQENETGEIVWDAFSAPELNNFMIVLDREEGEAIAQLQYKYRVMKRIIHQRMKELRQQRQLQSESKA